MGKTTSEMKLIETDKLIPYVNNARTHSKEQINKLRSSLREFGFINPILISEDNVITAGHCRLLAAKRLGLKKVPCIKESYMTPAQRKAYVIADNKLALGSGWDEELLKIEIESLQGEDFDISLTGFDESELLDLFEEESLPRNTYKSKNERKKATRDFRKSTYKSSYLMYDQGGERIDVCINKSNTLTSSMKNHVPIVFENHGQDLRFKGPLDVSKTITASFGTGGNNQPFVVEENKFYDIRLTSENTKNHRANVYETKISRTLNTGDNSPNANQGGLAIVYATSKNSHHTIAIKDKASTLVATDYKDPPIINENLRVRRLMPKECGRLQGFPDYWCDNLAIENPTDEDISFFKGVFYTDSKIHGKKEKSEKQIKRFLLNPHSDSAEYKMWDNGVALPCVIFILEGIKKAVDVKI